MKTAAAHWLLTGVLLACGTLRADAPLPDALRAGWQGKPVCEQLREGPGHRLLRCTFAPGVGHERHFHPAHTGYALSGGTMRITDTTGTRDQVLQTGASYTSIGTAWHEVVNVGTTPVIYLIYEQTPAHPAPR